MLKKQEQKNSDATVRAPACLLRATSESRHAEAIAAAQTIPDIFAPPRPVLSAPELNPFPVFCQTNPRSDARAAIHCTPPRARCRPSLHTGGRAHHRRGRPGLHRAVARAVRVHHNRCQAPQGGGRSRKGETSKGARLMGVGECIPLPPTVDSSAHKNSLAGFCLFSESRR